MPEAEKRLIQLSTESRNAETGCFLVASIVVAVASGTLDIQNIPSNLGELLMIFNSHHRHGRIGSDSFQAVLAQLNLSIKQQMIFEPALNFGDKIDLAIQPDNYFMVDGEITDIAGQNAPCIVDGVFIGNGNPGKYHAIGVAEKYKWTRGDLNRCVKNGFLPISFICV